MYTYICIIIISIIVPALKQRALALRAADACIVDERSAERRARPFSQGECSPSLGRTVVLSIVLRLLVSMLNTARGQTRLAGNDLDFRTTACPRILTMILLLIIIVIIIIMIVLIIKGYRGVGRLEPRARRRFRGAGRERERETEIT